MLPRRYLETQQAGVLHLSDVAVGGCHRAQIRSNASLPLHRGRNRILSFKEIPVQLCDANPLATIALTLCACARLIFQRGKHQNSAGGKRPVKMNGTP